MEDMVAILKFFRTKGEFQKVIFIQQ